MADLNHLLDKEEKWVISILAASGGQEPSYPTEVHFTYGAKRGDETYDDPNITLNDIPAFDALFHSVEEMLAPFGYSADHHRYHSNDNPIYFVRFLEHKVNAFVIRIAWKVTAWDMQAIKIAREMATLIRQHCEPGTDMPDTEELEKKDIAYDGYTS